MKQHLIFLIGKQESESSPFIFKIAQFYGSQENIFNTMLLVQDEVHMNERLLLTINFLGYNDIESRYLVT